MNYFQNIQNEICKHGLRGSNQKTNSAFKNRKQKAAKILTPRGTAFARLDALYTNIWRVNLVS